MRPFVTPATLDAKTAEWLDKIAPFNTHRMRLAFEKAALLVIDMQNFFIDESSSLYVPGGVAIIPKLKKLIEAFRAAGRPVIFTRHVHHPDGHDAGILGWWWHGMILEGSADSEIHAELTPRPGEKTIFKHRYSAFYNTDLEIVLGGMDIEDIVITGVMTNLCCESTARGAYYRDYRVFFPADGTGTITEEMQLGTLLNLGFGFAYVTAVDEIIEQLG